MFIWGISGRRSGLYRFVGEGAMNMKKLADHKVGMSVGTEKKERHPPFPSFIPSPLHFRIPLSQPLNL